MDLQSYPLLGTRINALTITDLNQLVGQIIQGKLCQIIANHNLHSLYVFYHDCKMREFYSCADFIHMDGMPLVFMGKLLGYPFERKHRVTYADWIYSLMQEAEEKGWRTFYLGSKPGVAANGARLLQDRFPNLQISTKHGYFDMRANSEENLSVISEINEYKPNLLMVGMSMPRQEHWIVDNFQKLNVNVILPCGAAVDYVAGAVPTPPRLAGRLGIEWFFRLISEPKRLWKRYLVEPWFVMFVFLKGYLKRGEKV